MGATARLHGTATARHTTPTIRVVALDFDGVVVDSMPLQERAWREAADGVLECQEQKDAIVRNLYAGKAREKMFDGIKLSKEKREVLRARKDALWSRPRRTVPLMRGARRMIPLLARRYHVVIATTGERTYVENILSRERLDRYINHVITDADVRRPKPAPDMLEALARRFGIEANQLCMVGDTNSDRDMSRAAGSLFIRFGPCKGPGTARTQTVANSWWQLRQLLRIAPSASSSPTRRSRRRPRAGRA